MNEDKKNSKRAAVVEPISSSPPSATVINIQATPSTPQPLEVVVHEVPGRSAEVIDLASSEVEPPTEMVNPSVAAMFDTLKVSKYRQKKLDLEKVISELRVTEGWSFHSHIDKKAKVQLVNFIYDHYLEHQRNAKLQKKVEAPTDLYKSYHEKMMTNYTRWCTVSGQDVKKYSPSVLFSQHADADTQLLADALLLLNVWGQVDVVRSQNNITTLIFQGARKFLLLQKQAEQPNAKKADPARVTAQQFATVAAFVKYQANFIYQLVKHIGFNRTKRNEFFVNWDDLNASCWTPGFVKVYMKTLSFAEAFQLKSKSMLLEKINLTLKRMDYSVQDLEKDTLGKVMQFMTAEERKGTRQVSKKWNEATALKIKKPEIENLAEPTAKPASTKTPEELKKEKEEKQKKQEKKFTNEKDEFVKKWKIYFERGGGWQGWKAYLTILHNFSLVVHVQLIFLSIMLYLLLEFPAFKTKLIYIMPFCGIPLAVSLVIGLLQFFVLQWTTKAYWHPYKLTIPRRDSLISRPSYRLNNVLWIVIMLVQVLVVRFMLFENLYQATKTVVYQISKNQFSMLSIAALAMNWVPVFVVYWTVAPVVFTVLKSVFGMIYAIRKGANHIVNYGQFKNKLRNNTTLKHFHKKMLGPENKDLPMDEVRYRFAIVFNAIIEDFYLDHMCSEKEKDKLSFDFLPEHHEKCIIPEKYYAEQLKKITTLDPLSPELKAHMVKWLNNLYISMPTDCSVEWMKRLVVLVPVYKESVLYSWKELTAVTNTSSSFLHHLIKKYSADWRNFKQMERKHKEVLLIIERLVRLGIDISANNFPVEVVEKIRFWASDRFQPVSRTFGGLVKIGKALKVLLKVQTLQHKYSEEELDKIVKDKFMVICGAQVLDPSIWAKNEDNSQYRESFLLLLKKFGEYVRLAYQKEVTINSSDKKSYVGVLLKHDPKSKSSFPFEEVYNVPLLGKFDTMGQGKPSHQSFMIQFFDGSYIEAIDCNQAGRLPYFYFVPNVLSEFLHNPKLKIIGFPEYIFTESWSHAGFGSAFTEKVFGTMIQRCWALLGMRMHYGHPDYIDGHWAMFTTGMSNLSNVSEDVFLGLDTVLNGGQIGFVEYMYIGKARDVCLFTTSKFNRKISGGAAQLAISRHLNELMTSYHLSVGEKLTLFYSTQSHYLNSVFIIGSTFLMFFLRVIILTMRIFELEAQDENTSAVWKISDYIFIVQLGTALSLPGFLQMVLDYGLFKGIWEYFFKFKFFLVSVYSVFHLLNTAVFYHYGLFDACQYLASGRGAGLDHESIGKIIATFDSTHFTPSIVLFIYGLISISLGGSLGFFIYNMFLGAVWLWSPFIFNRGSLPINGVLYETWVKLYGRDVAYVKQFKVKQIVRELTKLTKKQDVLQFYEKQNEDIIDQIVWVNEVDEDASDVEDEASDVDDDASDLETTVSAATSLATPLLKKKTSNLHAVIKSAPAPALVKPAPQIDSKEEKIFQDKIKKKEGKWYKLSNLRHNVRALIWNVFLVITLAGLKYLGYFCILLNMANPLNTPPARPHDLEQQTNHSRFQHLQKQIRDSNRTSKAYVRDSIASLQQQIEQLVATPQALSSSSSSSPFIPAIKFNTARSNNAFNAKNITPRTAAVLQSLQKGDQGDTQSIADEVPASPALSQNLLTPSSEKLAASVAEAYSPALSLASTSSPMLTVSKPVETAVLIPSSNRKVIVRSGITAPQPLSLPSKPLPLPPKAPKPSAQ